MKYEIDTIPVWDALKADTECPLCLLERRSRLAALRYYLGPSVMVPEVRVTVNETGFCPENLRLLSKDPNKLGLALISHTRLKSLRAKLNGKCQALNAEAARAVQRNSVENLVGQKKLKDQLAAAVAFLKEEEDRCLIENKVSEDRSRYAFTLLHLWKGDKEFRSAWNSSRGSCLRHARDLLTMAGETLSGATLGTFVQEYLDLLDKNLARVQEDVLSFTQTFDSTHSHVPAGAPEGALERCLQKLAGTFPEYEEASKTRKGPLMGGVGSS